MSMSVQMLQASPSRSTDAFLRSAAIDALSSVAAAMQTQRREKENAKSRNDHSSRRILLLPRLARRFFRLAPAGHARIITQSKQRHTHTLSLVLAKRSRASRAVFSSRRIGSALNHPGDSSVEHRINETRSSWPPRSALIPLCLLPFSSPFLRFRSSSPTF